ncbi:ODA11 [Symbiodinium sp. KB8]|nr:ODA11 [Symbiodinium sp. KB8]
MSGVFGGLLQAKPGEFADAEKARGRDSLRGKFNFAKYFQEKNPEPLVFAPFSKGIQEMDGGGFYDKIPSTERLSQLLGEALREFLDGGTYGLNDLKGDLQGMYMKAGVKDEGVMFLFTDGQITNEKFLVFINDLLASGDIADLYAMDEKDAIRNGVRSGCKGAGIQAAWKNEAVSIENHLGGIWQYLISLAGKNLHMSLCFSPVGDAMRGRARKFPALVNCMKGPSRRYNVGAKFLEPIEQLGPQDSPVRQGIMEFLPYSFEAAGNVATKFMEVQRAREFASQPPTHPDRQTDRRFAYTTPKSFLELIKLYTSMVGNKVDALEDQKNRLTNGLEKLHATSEQVAGLEEELKEKAVVVAEKAAAADVFAKEVGEKKATVEEESSKAAVEAEKCAKIAKEVSVQQADCEKDLAAAIPLVKQAEAALDVLDKKDFQELKALAKPPGGVDLVLEAAMHLQAGYDENIELDKKGAVKDPTWKGAQKMMNNPEKFLINLKGFKGHIDDGKVPQVNVERARKIQKDMGDDFSQVWIINIIMYFDVVVQVEPKRNALRDLAV